jgi:RNA 2',3'-cyclic 3'-phosphodiesterase
MRFFIALEIPEESQHEIHSIQQKIKNVIPNMRLTDPHKLHLTLAFVGDQQSELSQDLTKVLEHAVEGIKPFEITPAYLDAFPKLHDPRVFWLGVKGDVDKLFWIEERLRDGLADLHLDTDSRRFIPHISIGKVSRIDLSRETEEKIEEIVLNHEFGPLTIHSIKLFESVPNEGFHTHNTLAKIPLVL